jgi:hypothetical protein
MNKIIVLLSITVSLISCQKDKESISNLIVGKWEWVKTIIPYGGLEANPQTLGFTRTLEFMVNGKMKEYKNELLIKTSNYSIEINPSNANGFLLKSTIVTSHFYIINDSLIFNEAYVDGPVSTYLRRN